MQLLSVDILKQVSSCSLLLLELVPCFVPVLPRQGSGIAPAFLMQLAEVSYDGKPWGIGRRKFQRVTKMKLTCLKILLLHK